MEAKKTLSYAGKCPECGSTLMVSLALGQPFTVYPPHIDVGHGSCLDGRGSVVQVRLQADPAPVTEGEGA